ncbi:protein kinase, putative [Yasminevirus sp. GU-2018]|uniref:non-specific serine/threonine protein kinase n=1 Tax=Yasminevirus sp. GU-2018 TaxID=2420051 RepID=A0A5K0U6W4_9VIRU|nr:protein kinase, putative [Yasminevirus sp. GU-2018]
MLNKGIATVGETRFNRKPPDKITHKTDSYISVEDEQITKTDFVSGVDDPSDQNVKQNINSKHSAKSPDKGVIKTVLTQPEPSTNNTKPKYTFVKTLAKNVCLCQNQNNELFVAKYGLITSSAIKREIAITKLLGSGTYTVRRVSINTSTKKTEFDKFEKVVTKIERKSPREPEEVPFIKPKTDYNRHEILLRDDTPSDSSDAPGTSSWLSRLLNCLTSCFCLRFCCQPTRSKQPITVQNSDQNRVQITDRVNLGKEGTHAVNTIKIVNSVNTVNTVNVAGTVVGTPSISRSGTSGNMLKSNDEKDKIEDFCDDVSVISEKNGDVLYRIVSKTHNTDLFSQVVSVDISPTKYYMVLKYAGRELYESVTNDKVLLTESNIKTIFRKALTALMNMHELGIAHGDVSLENICTEEDDDELKVRLIDFGLSIVHPNSPYYKMVPNKDSHEDNKDDTDDTDNKSRPYVVVDDGICDAKGVMITKLRPTKHNLLYGKERYISPERYDCHNNPDMSYCSYSDDLYSLGVVLFTLIAKQMPYFSPTFDDPRFSDIITGRWVDKRDVYGLNGVTSSISGLDSVLNLLSLILVPQSRRLTAQQILDHKWVNESLNK